MQFTGQSFMARFERGYSPPRVRVRDSRESGQAKLLAALREPGPGFDGSIEAIGKAIGKKPRQAERLMRALVVAGLVRYDFKARSWQDGYRARRTIQVRTDDGAWQEVRLTAVPRWPFGKLDKAHEVQSRLAEEAVEQEKHRLLKLLTSPPAECDGTNRSIGELLGKSDRQVARLLKLLEADGAVSIEHNAGSWGSRKTRRVIHVLKKVHAAMSAKALETMLAGEWDGTNRSLGKLLGKSTRQVCRLVRRLEELGFIKVIRKTCRWFGGFWTHRVIRLLRKI